MSDHTRHGIHVPSNTLGALDDVSPAPAAPTLGALDEIQSSTKPTAAGTSSAAANPAAASTTASSNVQQPKRFNQPPRAHYLLSLFSETSVTSCSDDHEVHKPISPRPLPALTLPMLPAAATSESSMSEALFSTPRSRVSDSGSMHSMGSAVEFKDYKDISQDGSNAAGSLGQLQQQQQQRSGSPLRTMTSAHTSEYPSGDFSQDTGTAGVAGNQAQLLQQQQRSGSPLRTMTSAHTGDIREYRSGSSAAGSSMKAEIVAAGVMGTSISLSQAPRQTTPLPLTLQTQQQTQQHTEQQQQQQQQQQSLGDIVLATLQDTQECTEPAEPAKVPPPLLAPRKGVSATTVSKTGATPSTVMAGSSAAAAVAAAVAATKAPRKGAAGVPGSHIGDPIPRVVVEGTSLGTSFDSGTATPVDSNSAGGSSTTATTLSTSLHSYSGGGGSPRVQSNSGGGAAAGAALAAATAATAAAGGTNTRHSSGGGRHGVRMAPADAAIAREVGSSRKQQQQQQQSAVAALTGDIIAAAAAGAAAGAALAAIAEVGEDKKQPQAMKEEAASARLKQLPILKAQGSSSPKGSPTSSVGSSSGFRSVSSTGSAPSSPSIGITLMDPAAAAAAAASARRRSQSNRSRKTSAAGTAGTAAAAAGIEGTAAGKGVADKGADRDIAAQADIEQPEAVVMTPRGSITQAQKRHSSAGGSKMGGIADSLTTMLGVAAAKLTPKKALPAPPQPGDSAAASRAFFPATNDKKDAAAADQPPSKRRKNITWGLLATGLLALLIVVAVAIAVPVSKQNAANRNAAAQATGLRGQRGVPLTFRVDVQVPPDAGPGAGPVCGALFGGSGDKVVEGYLGVFRRTLATEFQIKPNEIAVNSVTCNNTPVRGATGAPASLGANLPRPAHKRMLLQGSESDSQESSDAATESKMRIATPSNLPATLATVFQVPAPADPSTRAQLAADIKQGVPETLTGPLSEFFRKPVTVLPPQQLQDPARKPSLPSEAARKPRGLPLTPLPSWEFMEPPPSVQVIQTEIAEEVPVQVITEIPGRNATAPVARPQQGFVHVITDHIPKRNATAPVTTPQQPSEKPRQPFVGPQQPLVGPQKSSEPDAVPENDTEDSEESEKSEETPTLSLQLPKMAMSDATKPQGQPPADRTLPSPPPAPVKQVLWANAPQCKGKPDGQNSVPDSEGRLWGWQGESCTFKTLLRTPVYITWSNAPACEEAASTSNSVYDRSGRLWGWSSHDKRSCAFRNSRLQLPGDPAQPVLAWQTAPACKGAPTAMNSVRARAGEIWGYEDGQSCAFRIHSSSNNWSTTPKCRELANYYNSVRDALGRSWGFEEGRSCRF